MTRPLIIDSFAGGTSEAIPAALGRLLPGHLPSLLGDALLSEPLRFGTRLFVGTDHSHAIKQIGLAASRGDVFQDRLVQLRARLWLRLRNRDGPSTSPQRALRRSLFRELKLHRNP